MVFLASVLTQLLLAGTLLLAAVLGSAVAYFYAQARRREAAESERAEREMRQRDAELSHIRHRIEEIYERQQTGSETQFARVNQDLEEIQSHLDARGRQIDGVQGQLRYELKRHEEEIAELRNQLREAVEVFAAAALPAARPAAPALEAHAEPPAPAEPEAVPSFAPLSELLKDDHELLDDMFGGTHLDSETEPEDAAHDDAAPEAERSFTAHDIVAPSSRIETNDDFEFVDLHEVPAPSPVTFEDEPSIDEPSFEDAGLSTDYSGDGMRDLPAAEDDAFAAGPAVLSLHRAAEFDSAEASEDAVPAPPVLPPATPEGHDDLTELSAVDAAMQQKLYALGVTTIEAVARWSRTDARRIASQLTHTSEVDIMDHWVFEAQSILFERYQKELREQTRRHAANAG